MHTIYLHTGTNLGKRRKNLVLANRLIEELIGEIITLSAIYETAPWGKTDQPDFLNQAVKVTTTLAAEEVLEAIREIERRLGRKREIRWGARLIDVDILFYDELIVDTPELEVPHPRLHLRNFVLKPLEEIAADLVHPVLGKNIAQLSAACTDPLIAKPLSYE